MCHMNLVYNNQDDIASVLFTFFKNINVPLSLPNLKMLSFSIISMVNSESVVTSDLAKSIDSSLFSFNINSIEKRFWRFFNNKNVNIYDVYSSLIKFVISNISNVRHGELIVTLNHMFTKNNFVTLMFTLRIDNQGIPIWFSTEKTSSNSHSDIGKHSRKKLFNEDFIKNAIDDVVSLLKPLNSKIIFLADRWFFNLSLLKYIDSKNCFYAFRAKANSSVKFLHFDKHEGHYIYKHLSDLKPYVFKTSFYENLELGDLKLKCNLSIAPSSKSTDESWYIVTNMDPHFAIRKYKKRFGSIEMLFKSQKTSGFYLESTKTKNLHAFENLYGITCIAHLWLSILGLDYIKNYIHKKHILNIKYNKKTKSGNIIRILSTFKIGLTLFKRVYKSSINYIIKCNFKLYL